MTARPSDPKEPQETQCVTVAAKPPSNTLRSLPLPVRHPELTRSQLIFSISTSIDPRSLAIERKDEFFLFMEMRAEHQWASFSMTCRKWVTATSSFNTQLEERQKGGNLEIVKKNPRALMDKLAEVEQQIIQRFTTGNFTCKQCSNEAGSSPCSDLLKHALGGQLFGKSTAVPSHSLKAKIQVYRVPRILGNQM